MNGPAKLFSLHPERPEHFVQYLARFATEWGWSDPLASHAANSFAPRWVYGDYIRRELARAVARAAPLATFEHIAAEATDLRRGGSRTEVVLPGGHALAADHVVLALGAAPTRPSLPFDPAALTSARYIARSSSAPSCSTFVGYWKQDSGRLAVCANSLHGSIEDVGDEPLGRLFSALRRTIAGDGTMPCGSLLSAPREGRFCYVSASV